MLDHYYTPRDALIPLPDPHLALALTPPLLPSAADKPLPPRAAVVDLSALSLEQLAFDCDSASDSGSDDGYVSTLLRIQRTLPVSTSASASAPATPRKIAGARRVARAVSSPGPQLHLQPAPQLQMDVEVAAGVAAGPEGELFQSITAIPGLESTSFEVRVVLSYISFLRC